MLDSNKLLYVNRFTEQELFIEALNQGNYLDINGIYGQGKTSFLKWIHENQTNYCCIYIDLTASNADIHHIIANYHYDEILYPDNPFSEFKLKSQNSVIDFESFNKGLNYILTFQKIVVCLDNTDAITAKNWQAFEENISKHYSDNPNLILVTTSQVYTQFNNQLKQRLKCVSLSNFTKTQIQEYLEQVSKQQDFVIENQNEIADELLKATNGHTFSINFLISLWSDNFKHDLNIINVQEQFSSSITQLIKVLIEEKILSQLELDIDVNKAKLFLQTIAPLRYILPRTQHHLLVHFLPEYETQQPFLAVKLSGEFQKINLLSWKSSLGYKLNLTIRHLLLTEMLLTSKQKFLVIQNSLVELYDNMTHESQGDSKISRFIEKLYHYAIFLIEKESDELDKLVGKEIQSYLNQNFESDSSLLTEIDITVLNQLKQALTDDTQLTKLVDVEFLIKIIDNFIEGEIEEEEEDKQEQKEEVTSTSQPQPEVLIDNHAVLSRPVTGDTVWINLLTNRLLSIDHEYDQTEFLLENGADIKGNYRLNARLEEELGENDAGVVWKATDLLQEAAGSRDKLVVIKFLSQAFFKQHPETLKKLAFEFNRYKRLHHPNLAAADEINHIGNYIFIVMGFLQGIPLTQFIKNNPQGISLNDAKPIIQGIGNALAYMHDKGIMRVDLKPSNIDYDPVRKFAKLVDFAIARTIIPIKRINTQTESYISLENLSDIDPSPADDIYAFACITYELLSGKHPFDRKTALKAQRDQLVPEPIDKLTVEQNQTLLKALEFEKEHRISTINQFLAGLFPPPPKPPMWVNLLTSSLLSEDEQDTIIEEGTIIRDHYRLLQVIDEDGFGTVWQAIDLTLDNKYERYVAIKFVDQTLFKQNIDILKNLVHEYSQGSRYKKISNAHIVTAYELDRFGNKIFTVTEFLAATSLKELLKEYPKGLPFKKVKAIITNLAQTIAALHEKGLSCLKLAPANIFYDPDRKITQIIQFDITSPFKENQIKAYQSIETLSNLDSSPQDDIYALACITYELLTGEHPFAGKTALTANEENLSPKPILQLEATASQTLLRSLSFKKEDRTIKIDEFINNIFTKQSKYFMILIINIIFVAAVAMAIFWFNSVENVKTPEPEPIPSESKIPQVEAPKTEISEPEVPSEPQIELNVLLEECNKLYKLQYYTKNDSGGDRTALLCYREVMEREPNNIEAKTQLENMENYYITRVKNNIHLNRLKAAETWLLALKQVNPNSPDIAQLESALKRKEQ
jgi:serine/threonine protein kinase